MNLIDRINAFIALGQSLQALSEEDFQSLAERSARENPWFTPENIRRAIEGVAIFLQPETLTSWTSRYNFSSHPKTVAVVMAGNIPLVGFHDLLTVLLSGHNVQMKLSSKDSVCMKSVIDRLVAAEPRFRERIVMVEQLKGFDAVIATGSDNTARYFDYYFGKYPNVIRKNRTSIAILDRTESPDNLNALGYDIFSYFGLGCRNVSKLFVPEGYDFTKMFPAWESFAPVIHHHKYCNNYDYQKSILLVNNVPFLDNGFVMLQESERIVSPISIVYYEYYSDRESLTQKINSVSDKIQCIVGTQAPATVTPGSAQCPAPWDYADQVDTLAFLSKLN